MYLRDMIKMKYLQETLLCLYILQFVCLLIVIDEKIVKSCPLKLTHSLFVWLLRENLLTGTFFGYHVLLTGTVPLGINQIQDIEMYLSTYSSGLFPKQSWKRCVLYIQANLLKVELRASLPISHKIIFHIRLLPWLVSILLISCIYGTYCTVYTVQCKICTVNS